ncbi:MAG: NF041680 family putative transposase [Vicinamibacterales bacterium]|nr:NF041680 family putative transposase [Vicinamibacterales bacterium]
MGEGGEGRDGGASRAALVGFRTTLYGCFTRWGDALFELADAALCAPAPVGSVPALSLEPVFRRSHGSLYKALARGRIDSEALRRALVAHRPADWPAVFAVDASTWDRCDAETSPERGFYYSASRHSAGQPIVAGWSYQWICQLDWAADSWTAPLDAKRIAPREDATTATIVQVHRLVGLLGDDGPVPLFVFDAGYDPIALGAGLADTRAQVVVRIRSDRVFHPDPDPKPAGAVGRPRRHGPRFALSDPASWTEPDTELGTHDPRYGDVRVQAWHGLHPKLQGRGRWAGADGPPIVRGTVIRVEVEHLPKRTARAKKTLWLFWSGPGLPDLDVCWRAYLRRFDIEHTYRFAKQALGWTTPALRTPEQADRWTWLIVAAYTQMRLARGLVADDRLPWERPCDTARLTPTRVRRGFRRLRAAIGTPASPPKCHRAGPGRPRGTRRPPRTRYPALKKAA